MENIGIGAGLGAMAFWIFVAAAVVASYWDGIKKRETQHETVRRAIESGNQIDEDMMNKLMSMGSGGGSRADRDFKVTALWMLPIAPGMAVFAYVLSSLEGAEAAFYPLMGVAGLIACMAAGFWIAGMIVSRWYQD